MNKFIINAIAATAFAWSAMLGSVAQAELRSITIGTNPSGSTFYLIGSGIAKMYLEKLRVRSNVQPQVGSSVYLPMINSGELTLGLASSMDSYFSYTGDGFPAESKELRALANIWVLPYTFIVRRDSGIKTMEDLKGKRVMGDMPTNVALTRLNRAMLRSGGLSSDDVDFTKSGGLIDGIKAVVDGRADAAPVATTMPQLIEANSSVDGGIAIVANGTQAVDGYYEGEVPGTRVGMVAPNDRQLFISEETAIVNYDTLFIAGTAMSDDDAYRLTKTLYENWPDLQKDYPPLRGVSQEQLLQADPSIPYHPGAIRFYKEIGAWTDAHDDKQTKLLQ